MANAKAQELTKTVETADAIITTTLDKKLVNKFDEAYTTAGDSMRDMCILAYQICGDDKDAKQLFQKHVVNDLGMSKSTATQLVATGGIYTTYPDTQIMSHTKCAELLPVRNDVNAFLDAVELDIEELNTLTQVKIREKVKNYLNPTQGTQDTTQDTQDAEETTQDTQDAQDTIQDAQDTQETENPRITELENRVKYLLTLCKGAHEMLVKIDNEYELDEDDTKVLKFEIKSLATALKMNGGNK